LISKANNGHRYYLKHFWNYREIYCSSWIGEKTPEMEIMKLYGRRKELRSVIYCRGKGPEEGRMLLWVFSSALQKQPHFLLSLPESRKKEIFKVSTDLTSIGRGGGGLQVIVF
jgi:hypothetical protein